MTVKTYEDTAVDANSMFAKLKSCGYSKKMVCEVILPPWWDIGELSGSVGRLETILRIRNYTGIDITEDAPVSEPKGDSVHQFRGGNPVDECFGHIKSFAPQVAEIIASACEQSYQGIPDAAVLRDRILAYGKSPWVNFELLLTECWKLGVPVVPLRQAPKSEGSRRPFAMCVNTSEGRPVVFLLRNFQKTGRLLWDLAHEVGHIARGHLKAGRYILDEDRPPIGNDIDWAAREDEANSYGLNLLTGSDNDPNFRLAKFYPAPRLLELAQSFARKFKIDPAFVLLNYANGIGNTVTWRTVQAAINLLDGDPKLLSDRFHEFTPSDCYSGDEFRFVKAACGF